MRAGVHHIETMAVLLRNCSLIAVRRSRILQYWQKSRASNILLIPEDISRATIAYFKRTAEPSAKLIRELRTYSDVDFYSHSGC